MTAKDLYPNNIHWLPGGNVETPDGDVVPAAYIDEVSQQYDDDRRAAAADLQAGIEGQGIVQDAASKAKIGGEAYKFASLKLDLDGEDADRLDEQSDGPLTYEQVATNDWGLELVRRTLEDKKKSE